MRFSKFLVFLMVSLVLVSEFAVFRLVPSVKAQDPNFGYETAGSVYNYFNNVIRGSFFTCPENGTADSITVYTRAYSSDYYGNMKCAIYKLSDLSLVGVTEEIYIDFVAAQWKTFNFPSPKPSLTATDYILVGWSSTFMFAYYDTETSKGRYQSLTYNSFPNPLNPTIADFKHSIYCTYTVAGGQSYTVNLSQTVTTTLSSATQSDFKLTITQPTTFSFATVLNWNALLNIQTQPSVTLTQASETDFTYHFPVQPQPVGVQAKK